MKDIQLAWSKKEKNFKTKTKVGYEADAKILSSLTAKNSRILKELSERGYDLTTLTFSINKKKEEVTLSTPDLF